MELLLFGLIALFVASLFLKVLRKVVKFALFIFVLLWVYNTFFADAQAVSIEIASVLC
ncbi:MAG: hypothetical protein ABS948_08560 [Solibacillus sp.]